MTRRTYPTDSHGNTIFPRTLRRIEWHRGLWIYRYTVGGFEGYRKLFSRAKTAGITLATWKWSNYR